MFPVKIPLVISLLLAGLLALAVSAAPARSEILNGNEFGSLEIIDIGVIENAASIYLPNGLYLDKPRGAGYYQGDGITIRYLAQADMFVNILDFSPDRTVKPIVYNQEIIFNQGGLHREFSGAVGNTLGREYILMVTSKLPLTDAQLEAIALAPDEIETGDLIVQVSLIDFTIVADGRNPNEVIEWAEGNDGINMIDSSEVTGYTGHDIIPLSEMGTQLEYPEYRFRNRIWIHRHSYPYPWLVPTTYIESYGLFSNVYYTIPVGVEIRSNFWNFASSGWIEDGIWFIPPGGYWTGEFEVGDYYSDYFLRILPYLIRENNSYQRLRVEINGVPVGNPVFDITDAIGWGTYWTENPFMYYNLQNYLRNGRNTITMYWPEEETENLAFQMVDVLPDEVLAGEVELPE